MKPAGRERDKQIAELKGLQFVNEKYITGAGDLIPASLHYSTSWNDAKELLIEMYGYIYHPMTLDIQIGKGWVGISSYNHKVKVVAHFKGEDVDKAIADAASQAWIKWKETK